MEPVTASLWGVVHKVVGSFLVLSGLVVLPSPIPIGLMMIVLGLAMLAPYFKPIQRLLRRLRRKYPKVDATMLRIKHRCPRVIRMAIEKTNPHKSEPETP